jgi:cytochrome c oxidase cbb3-type subunit I/II
MVRPFRYETERYGDYSKPGETVYEHPFLWGSRRIGPDLAREGGKYPDLWHVRHFQNPRAISPRSIMPAYGHLMTAELDFEKIQSRVDAMAMLGVPYGDAVNSAPSMARTQALTIANSITAGGGESGLETREIVAMIAYMQRLGRDAQQVVRGAQPAAGATAGSAR